MSNMTLQGRVALIITQDIYIQNIFTLGKDTKGKITLTFTSLMLFCGNCAFVVTYVLLDKIVSPKNIAFIIFLKFSMSEKQEMQEPWPLWSLMMPTIGSNDAKFMP